MLLHAHLLCARTLLLCVACAGKSLTGKLVIWVAMASFEKIWKLLEIFEWERHQEVLTWKNLGDLSHKPAPYSVLVIPRPLPTKIMEGEHYVTADLLNSLPRNSSPTREPETEAASQESVIRTQ